MKLGPKITLGYVLSAFLVIIVAVINYQASERIEQQQETLVGTVMPNLQAIHEVEVRGLRIVAITSELIWMHARDINAFDPEEWGEELAELQNDGIWPYDAAITRYREVSQASAPHEIVFVETIESWGRQLKATSLKMLEMETTGSELERLNELREELEKIEQGFLLSIESAKAHESQELKLETENLQQELKDDKQNIIFGSSIAVVIVILFGMVLARSVSRPIIELKNAAVALGQGDLNARVKIRSKDEVGTLADSFNAMADELGMAAAVFENTSEAVLITDTNATIVAVNKAFEYITGYQEQEVVGRNPRLIKSNRHDETFYQQMWSEMLDAGMWRGEIWNRRKNGEVFPVWQSIRAIQNEAGDVSHYVSVFSDISTLKQSQEKLDYLAYHDPLTSLPNRLLFEDRLEQALKHAKRDKHEVALLILDLDRFKNINDSLGHPVGDALLVEIAKRLGGLVRQEDTVARLGGDEFVVILERTEKPVDGAVLAQKILDAFHASIVAEGHELLVTLSIGISQYPIDGEDVPTLVKNGDAALYRAKEEGRNCFKFYTSELTSKISERLAMETALRGALKAEQLMLYYQPVVSLQSGKITAVEALLRWNHPQHGLVLPDRFIALAEDTGLILPIGAWVMQQACQQARIWLDKGYDLERIAVNVSGLQIQRGKFVDIVTQALQNAGLEGRHLELEVTENVIMRNTEKAIAVLNQLKEMGVQVAIDDFGTGYSSLSYLKQLPIDKLKIDQSFVRDIPADANDKAIARAVRALAKSLKLKVVAEGIESSKQAAFLKRLGCDEGQGYLYSPPVTADELELLLKGDDLVQDMAKK